MKRIIVFIIVAICLIVNASTRTIICESTESEQKEEKNLKILIDESRVHAVDEETRHEYIADFEKFVEQLEQAMRALGVHVDLKVKCDPQYSFENLGEPWGFGLIKQSLEDLAEVTIRRTGLLNYPTLMKYDILVIASFNRSYSPGEVGAIKKFVENGGGLFLLADSDSQNNSVSDAFKVTFSDEGITADATAEQLTDVHTFYLHTLSRHTLTGEVETMVLKHGIPIIQYETGLVLGKTSHTAWLDRQEEGLGSQDKKEEEGPFDILLAMEDVGLGRAVFFGGALSFWNSVTMEEHNNIDLFINAVTWLGEPGGPYKQYLPLNEQAQTFLEEGMSLYDTHAFSEAQEQLLTACSLSEQSHDVYPHADSLRILEKAQSYIALCERGLEAETFFETAQTSFENREYETAIETYEAALALYTEIVYSERSAECNIQIEECKRLISLRDQAESLYTQAEEHLNQESGMFDTAGYQEARSLFEQSMEKWEAYGDPDKVTDCEEKIHFCINEISRVEQTKMLIIGGAVTAVIICGLAAFLFIRRRKRHAETQ